MSAAGPVAVCRAPLDERAADAIASVVTSLLVIGRDVDAGALGELAARRAIVWIPRGFEIRDDLASEIRSQVEAGAFRRMEPVVVLARMALRTPRATVPLEPAPLLSTPGAVTLVGGEPLPVPGARTSTMQAVVCLRGPASLSEHLHEINRETSERALLLHAQGRRPGWAGLTTRPAWRLLHTLLAARGLRREVLPWAVLEAYREVLVTSKLWEAGSAPPRGP